MEGTLIQSQFRNLNVHVNIFTAMSSKPVKLV